MARLKAFFTYVFLTLVCLGAGAVLPVNSAEDTGRPGTEIKPNHSKPAEQVYKNIQVLKGIPSDELIPAMQFVAASLGVECSFCHVERHFDQDDKKPKQIARKMMQMEMTINGRDFDTQLKVTCSTCHRGTRSPVSVPEIRDTDLAQVVLPPDSPNESLPSADQLLEKFVEAVGGASAIGKLETLYEKGTADFNGHRFAMELYAKAPANRIFVIHMPGGDIVNGFDGARGWSSAPRRATREMPTSEMAGAKMDADLQFCLHIRDSFGELRSAPAEVINGRDANQLVAGEGGLLRGRLYFDQQNGLLVRMMRFAKSPLGLNPMRIDYADYRPVAGLQIPFRWEVARPEGRFTVQLDNVQPNVPIEDRVFAPAPGAQAGTPPTAKQ